MVNFEWNGFNFLTSSQSNFAYLIAVKFFSIEELGGNHFEHFLIKLLSLSLVLVTLELTLKLTREFIQGQIKFCQCLHWFHLKIQLGNNCVSNCLNLL